MVFEEVAGMSLKHLVRQLSADFKVPLGGLGRSADLRPAVKELGLVLAVSGGLMWTRCASCLAPPVSASCRRLKSGYVGLGLVLALFSGGHMDVPAA